MDIYEQLKAVGVPIGSHESDLYAEVNAKSREIVSGYEYKCNVTTFRNQITGTLWYDIPFAYTPFWDQKLNRVTK